MSTKTLLKTLPLDTLVCHDFFGLGTTTSIISNSTNRPEMRKVNVAFDDDQDGGEYATTRTILISFLDWDSEDETDKTVKIRKAKNDEPDDAVDGIEALFDNPEMEEDEADDSDEGWVVATKKPADWCKPGADTDDTDNNDDDDFKTFMKDEFDGDEE